MESGKCTNTNHCAMQTASNRKGVWQNKRSVRGRILLVPLVDGEDLFAFPVPRTGKGSRPMVARRQSLAWGGQPQSMFSPAEMRGGRSESVSELEAALSARICKARLVRGI